MFEKIRDEFSQVGKKYFQQVTELKKQNTDMALRLFCKCTDVLDKMKAEIVASFNIPNTYSDTFTVDNREYELSIEEGEVSVEVKSEGWCGETLFISTGIRQNFSDLIDFHIQKVDIGLACRDIVNNAERLVRSLLECLVADTEDYYKDELTREIEINNKLKEISEE